MTISELASSIGRINVDEISEEKQRENIVYDTIPPLQESRKPKQDSIEVAEWRKWILKQLSQSVLQISGNEKINLIAGNCYLYLNNLIGWHGSSEEKCFSIAQNNFLEPGEIPMSKKTDPGYFGNGIYFTQFPSYGAMYADKEKQCMLISWVSNIDEVTRKVMMGSVYPVVERPTESNSLLGKPCVEGYNSHYAIVKQVSGKVYFPCKPHEKPDYDEVVVFSKAQILPRYIIYYR